MKRIILIGDGMGDYPVEELGGRTPLEAAATPNMDSLAGAGSYGLFSTVPDGFPPGSDVASLSIFGYDPRRFYTGRAPLEAASIGVRLSSSDMAFRCNLVTLVDKGGAAVMGDYSSGHISSEEAAEIIRDLDKAFSGEGVRFYPGTGYRHLMVWANWPDGPGLKTTPPHDITDKRIDGCLPTGEGAVMLIRIMERSQGILEDHPVNRARRSAGKKPATSVWLWGQGRAPVMPTFRERFGVEGSIISAVDLMKGIGIYAGLKVINVPGATGYIDTNYRGKAEHALKALDAGDFVCVHVEAPDEAGHNGNLKDKIRAIEDFDREVVGAVLRGVARFGAFRVAALADHPTPVRLKTHTSDPVPFVIYTSGAPMARSVKFSEKGAAATGLMLRDGTAFIKEFFGG